MIGKKWYNDKNRSDEAVRKEINRRKLLSDQAVNGLLQLTDCRPVFRQNGGLPIFLAVAVWLGRRILKFLKQMKSKKALFEG